MIDLDSPLASTADEINGVDREIGGITFRIKPFGASNREAMSLFVKLRGEVDVPQQIVLEHLPEVLQVLIVGWSGMCDTMGNEIPYTPETALELFNEHSKLAAALFEVASELGADDADALEEDTKN